MHAASKIQPRKSSEIGEGQAASDGSSRQRLSVAANSPAPRAPTVRAARRPAPQPRTCLVIAETGDWFQPVGGEVVLVAGAHIRKLLSVLAEFRVQAPGAPLSTDFLYMSAWPGELPSEVVVGKRLALAVEMLEHLGLKGVLVSGDGALYLDPDVDLAVEPRA